LNAQLSIAGSIIRSRGTGLRSVQCNHKQLSHLELTKERFSSSIRLCNARHIGLHDALEEARPFTCLRDALH